MRSHCACAHALFCMYVQYVCVYACMYLFINQSKRKSIDYLLIIIVEAIMLFLFCNKLFITAPLCFQSHLSHIPPCFFICGAMLQVNIDLKVCS